MGFSGYTSATHTKSNNYWYHLWQSNDSVCFSMIFINLRFYQQCITLSAHIKQILTLIGWDLRTCWVGLFNRCDLIFLDLFLIVLTYKEYIVAVDMRIWLAWSSWSKPYSFPAPHGWNKVRVLFACSKSTGVHSLHCLLDEHSNNIVSGVTMHGDVLFFVE